MVKTQSSGAARTGGEHPSGPPATPPVRRTIKGETALSDTHGVFLMVAITVILAAIVLLMLLSMLPPAGSLAEPQPPIIITEISHVNAGAGALTYASRVTLKNNSSTTYENDCLRAVFYVNGYKACIVQTLNGHLLIPSHHYGVKTLGGEDAATASGTRARR
ncbi:type IV pilin N-terminal domain-containing protein [Methanoculleus chikugoensis]|uniref:type IV pilin n=1 Tax=Methanoculleus chikugoensis TaxID=118126 RepID=UPI000AF284E0|nr:type IV pilin [Methanoculleus chikugoensis]